MKLRTPNRIYKAVLKKDKKNKNAPQETVIIRDYTGEKPKKDKK